MCAYFQKPFFQDPQWGSSALLLPTATAVLGGLIFVYGQRSWILNSLYDTIAKGRRKCPGKNYLEGVYAPLYGEKAEVFAEDLEVKGVLPAELDGVYMRGGPNPFYPPVHGYHWFDGDGLLHATRIKGGKASYDAHYIRTARLKQEQAAGKALFSKFGDTVGRRGLALLMVDALRKRTGAIDVSHGDGTANTALVYHAGRLLTLNEGDLPYQLRITCQGVVETIGRLKLPSKDGLNMSQFTAHPKIDAKTGEMLFLGYNFATQPLVKLGVMNASGELLRQWGINLPWPTMMHDMCITEHYFVLLHLPLCFKPELMAQGDSLPLLFNKDLPGRIGLLRRDSPGGDATDKVQWFELPAFMVFHTINACENEDGTVKVWACHFDSINLALDSKGELASPHMYTLDPQSGKAAMAQISTMKCDFPVTHPAMVGYPARWAWAGIMDPTAAEPDFIGIGKLDLHAPNNAAPLDTPSSVVKTTPSSDGAVKRLHFPAKCFGGEPYFVPRNPGQPTPENEDDGFLLVYVARAGGDLPSQLHVYDARTMSEEPVAVVTLPQRVPCGFHGMWISEEQRRNQRMEL